MPYETNETVPGNIPEDKKDLWRKAFNGAYKYAQGKQWDERKIEEYAFATAWSMINKMIEHEEKIAKEAAPKPGEDEFGINLEIIKTQSLGEDMGIIYLIASMADVEDAQEDVIPMDELRKSAYAFMRNSRKADMDHDWGDHGEIVESLIFDKAIIEAVKSGQIKEGMWVVGIEPHDTELTKMAARGEIVGASIGGLGRRSLS